MKKTHVYNTYKLIIGLIIAGSSFFGTTSADMCTDIQNEVLYMNVIPGGIPCGGPGQTQVSYGISSMNLANGATIPEGTMVTFDLEPGDLNGGCAVANNGISLTVSTNMSNFVCYDDFNWSCQMGASFANVSCSFPLTNGACGAANGVATRTAPTNGLCSAGEATAVAGSGPFTWNCNGLGGGSNASCSAPLPTVSYNACGPTPIYIKTDIVNEVINTRPGDPLCGGTTSQYTRTADCQYTFYQDPGYNFPTTVTGLTLNFESSCNMNYGVCIRGGTGSAVATGFSYTRVGCINESQEDFPPGGCGARAEYLTTLTSYSCSGAPVVPVNGQCGAASGQAYASGSGGPNSNLCSSGIPSILSGNGPWTWSCLGSNGGSDMNCSALLSGGAASCIPGSGNILEYTISPDATASQITYIGTGAPSTKTVTYHLQYSCGAIPTSQWEGTMTIASGATSGTGDNSAIAAACAGNMPVNREFEYIVDVSIACDNGCVVTTESPTVCDLEDVGMAGVCYIPPTYGTTLLVTNGMVGVNTITPTYPLDVDGTIRSAEILTLSDARLKTSIEKIDSALGKIRAINGYTFTWKDSGKPDLGVLAQEIEKVFADAVSTDVNGKKTVQYNALLAPIIEAIKELNTQIDSLYNDKFDDQVKRIEAIENKVK